MKVKTDTEIIEGVKKMTKIVKAAQRMENFIKNVCDIVLQGSPNKDIEVNLLINY